MTIKEEILEEVKKELKKADDCEVSLDFSDRSRFGSIGEEGYICLDEDETLKYIEEIIDRVEKYHTDRLNKITDMTLDQAEYFLDCRGTEDGKGHHDFIQN